MFTKGNNPLHVATTLGIGAQEARKLYTDYLDLKGCHYLVEILQQFNRQTIRDFSKSYITNDNKIDEKKLIEAVKISTSLPNIKIEFDNISYQLRDLRDLRDYYHSHNSFLINQNLGLQDELSLTQNKMKEYITELLEQKDSYIDYLL